MGNARLARLRGLRTPAIGLAISALSVWLLARTVDEHAFLEALRGTDPLLVALSVAFLFGSLAAKVARWRTLLPRDPAISYRRLFAILHAGMFLNNVLPLRAGDLTRGAVTARQPGLRLGHVVSSMVAERAADGTVLLLSFALAALALGDSGLDAQLRVALAVLAAIGVLGVLFVAASRTLLSRIPRRPAPPALVAFAESWRYIASPRGWPIWAWSAVAWLSAFTLHYLLLRAMGIEVHPLVAVIVTCTTNLAMLVPASPGHVGVYHAAATVTLVAVGVGSGDAAGFGVLAHLVNVVPVSLVGAAVLATGGLANATPDLPAPVEVSMASGSPAPRALASVPVPTSEPERSA